MYENLFTIINMVVEVAIQYPSSEAMILHERLDNRQDLYLNLSYAYFTELVLWDRNYIAPSYYQNRWRVLPSCLLLIFCDIRENVFLSKYI